MITPLSIFIAFCLGAVLFLWAGVNPIRAYVEILKEDQADITKNGV